MDVETVCGAVVFGHAEQRFQTLGGTAANSGSASGSAPGR
ncbi:hypothetical protein I550_3507 [Mycobacterium intracellulare 1956]|uniref:Uncharacterized protein n=1 Tax=Mycobacterium intracellulare 1956 TaxID=1299331 RepID=X8CHR9_MYCIT|nr:hypothetical protein I550_3507 [Mycobacterium intracellulare 1956]